MGRGGKENRYLLGAAAGIALSLIPIIVTLTVADGMIRGITDRFIELGTGHFQVWPHPQMRGDFAPDASPDASPLDAAADVVRQVDGVTGVWREIDGPGLILSTAGKTGASIRAIDPSFWQDAGSRRFLAVIAGEAVIKADNDILLGGDLARDTGAVPGGTVRLMTLRITDDGRMIPRTTIFKVRGIVSSGYHELDANWCIIGYDAGRGILSRDTSQNFLVVKTASPYDGADETAFAIYDRLAGGFSVYSWRQLQAAQYGSYESTRQMLIFIMAIVVLVAAVNVSSAVSMLVIERQRDIAVLKSTGGSGGEVSGVFLLCAVLSGFAGAIPGIACGLAIGCNVNALIRALETVLSFASSLVRGGDVKILDPGFYLQEIPVIIDWKTVAAIGLLTILCSAAASLVPSLRAGKSRPLDLLRKF